MEEGGEIRILPALRDLMVALDLRVTQAGYVVRQVSKDCVPSDVVTRQGDPIHITEFALLVRTSPTIVPELESIFRRVCEGLRSLFVFCSCFSLL